MPEPGAAKPQPTHRSQGISALTSVLLPATPLVTPSWDQRAREADGAFMEPASPELGEGRGAGWGDRRRLGRATIVPTVQREH